MSYTIIDEIGNIEDIELLQDIKNTCKARINELKKFIIILDNGKPDEIIFNTKKAVKQYLKELKKDYEKNKDNYAYFNITILQNNQDVTEYFFKAKEGVKA
jgi:uncharacterized protein YeeX (DUF496 family)